MNKISYKKAKVFIQHRLLHFFLISLISTITLLFFTYATFSSFPQKAEANNNESYWFLLHRKSEIEYLYFGVPGNSEKSTVIKEFQVNTGVPGQKPTPLPQLLGREYWVLKEKFDSSDNFETAPFFLSLDVPVSEDYPFGPTPYEECKNSPTAGPNGQCNWEIPGLFGLHGVAGNPSRLEDAGSSGCIRHSDADISYLYNLLDPEKQEIRYYVLDI